MRDESADALIELSGCSYSSLIPHPSSLTLAEAEGVEPTRDALPDCLADSSGYQFRHASEVIKSRRRVEDSNSYELVARQFSRLVPDRFGVLSAKVKQEHSGSNRKRRFWRPPCCQLHHAPKFKKRECVR